MFLHKKSALKNKRHFPGAVGAGVTQGLCNDLGSWMEIAWGCNCYTSQNLSKTHEGKAVAICYSSKNLEDVRQFSVSSCYGIDDWAPNAKA